MAREISITEIKYYDLGTDLLSLFLIHDIGAHKPKG